MSGNSTIVPAGDRRQSAYRVTCPSARAASSTVENVGTEAARSGVRSRETPTKTATTGFSASAATAATASSYATSAPGIGGAIATSTVSTASSASAAPTAPANSGGGAPVATV